MKCMTIIRCALEEISMDQTMRKVMELKQLTIDTMCDLVEHAYSYQPSKYHSYMTTCECV